jgi:phosphinothricin acetyltransferase
MPPTIRLATGDDAAGVLAIYAPFCTDTPVTFELEPPAPEEMRRRIGQALAALPWLVCAEGPDVLGYAYAGPHRERPAYRWSVEVSAYVAQGRRRRGLGRALYTSLFALLRLQGYANAFAGVTLPNPASVGLHEALGFVAVGVYRSVGYKCGAWHDVGWWQLGLRPHAVPPEPPCPLPLARTRPGWQEALSAGLPLLRPGAAAAR